jgi:NADP-dependent 3-hydroxy acid dehydrogenase YdfG
MSLQRYRVAAVSGASPGIGAEIVRRLRARGLEVHALARSASALQALADACGCIPHRVDIADRPAVIDCGWPAGRRDDLQRRDPRQPQAGL